MNLRHIQYAIEVDRQGSINKAAKALFVSQSAISIAIKDLETELELTLFERTANGMRPTLEGAVFLKEARNAMNAFSGLERTLRGLRSDAPVLSVITTQSSFIPPVIQRFVEGYEKGQNSFRLKYKTGETKEVIDRIASGEYDLGFIYASDYQEQVWKKEFASLGVEAQWLRSWPITAIFSKDDPLAKRTEVALTELSDYTFVYAGDDGLADFSNLADYSALNFDLKAHRSYVDAQDTLMLNLLMHTPGRFTIGHRAPTLLYRDAFAYVPLRGAAEAHLLMIKQMGRTLPSQATQLMQILKEAVDA